jgi:tRNA A-37 threonylcarbamoyl transferase component Bud32
MREDLSFNHEFLSELFFPSEDQILPQGQTVMRAKVYRVGGGILKHYFRGGLVSRFIQKSYFQPSNISNNQTRPFSELRILEELAANNVSVLHPLVAGIKRSNYFFYQGLLLTEELNDVLNLSEVVGQGVPSKIYQLAYKVGVEAKKMLNLQIFHRDLHPANVLVSSDEKIVLCDFDGAVRFNQESANFYRQRLIERWHRAVLKRKFPNELFQGFVEGLS